MTGSRPMATVRHGETDADAELPAFFHERTPLLENVPFNEDTSIGRHPVAHVPTPALHHNTPLEVSIGNDNDDKEPVKRTLWALWVEEFKVLSRYTAPVFGTQFLEHTLFLASIVSIGHVSTHHLAGVTLGVMTANVTGLSVLLGFVSALDSLLPQAWTSNPSLVGLWSQRMGVLMFILLIPIYAIWLSAEPILLALRQEPAVAHYASVYLRWLSIALPAYAFNCVARRYLQSQGLMGVPTTIIIAVVPLNIFLNWFLVWGPSAVRLGFIGAPVSTAISYNVIAFATATYIIFFDPRKAWHPLTRSTFQNLGILVRLGAAGVGLVAAEWWGWELIGLAASLLGPSSLASQAILTESAVTAYQAPFALGVATSVRIGHHLGAGNPLQAKVATYVSLLTSLAIGFVFLAVLVLSRHKWALMFNTDPEVVERAARVIPILAVSQILDGVCAVTSGVLRSQGKQALGAVLQFVSYYLIGMPFAMFLAFKFGMELPGLWIGMAVALFSGSVATAIIVLRTDWDYEVEKAAERLAEDGGETRALSTDTQSHPVV